MGLVVMNYQVVFKLPHISNYLILPYLIAHMHHINILICKAIAFVNVRICVLYFMSLKKLCAVKLALQCLASLISCNSAMIPIIKQKEETHLQSGSLNSQHPPPTDPPQNPSDSTKKTYQRTLPVLTFGQQEVQPTLFEELTELPSLPPAADSFTLQLPPTDTQSSAPAGV